MLPELGLDCPQRPGERDDVMMSGDPAGDPDLSGLWLRNVCCVAAGGRGWEPHAEGLLEGKPTSPLTQGEGCALRGPGHFGTWGLGAGGTAASRDRASFFILFYHTTGVCCVSHMPQAQSWVGHIEVMRTPGPEACSLVRKGLW